MKIVIFDSYVTLPEGIDCGKKKKTARKDLSTPSAAHCESSRRTSRHVSLHGTDRADQHKPALRSNHAISFLTYSPPFKSDNYDVDRCIVYIVCPSQDSINFHQHHGYFSFSIPQSHVPTSPWSTRRAATGPCRQSRSARTGSPTPRRWPQWYHLKRLY